MQSLRQQRVRELLKRELGEIIRREIAVDEAGLITVNDVALGGDLKSAVVFVGVIGTSDQQKRALTVLEAHRSRIQSLVSRAVVLKYTPRIRFEADTAIGRGNRVLAILNDIETTLPPNEAPPESH